MFSEFGISINIIAIIIAAVANMVIGFGWYSTSVFGKPWMKMLGMTKDDLEKAKKEMGPKYGIMVIASLVMACILAGIVLLAGSNTLIGGAKVGFAVWLGFVATIGLNSYIFESKPINLYFINVGYYLVALIVQGAILAAM